MKIARLACCDGARELVAARDERDLVKRVAKHMLDRVKELLVIDWRSKQQARAGIMLCIEDELDRLPDAYTKEIYRQKCSSVFQYVYQAFPQAPQRQ